MNKGEQKKRAKERIHTLFEQAAKRPEYAKRYITIAQQLSARYKTQIPKILKQRFCKQCNALLIPGKNSTVRIKKGRKITTCECGTIKRAQL
ncbi:ribonuclease P [Candidatus Woesearchaeota archaeon]|nr:ribonuclease P [Candidatus Woesearchaeota archaeon]